MGHLAHRESRQHRLAAFVILSRSLASRYNAAMSNEQPERRWFSYSLRTLLAVVTLLCVWLAVQIKWIRDRHAALENRLRPKTEDSAWTLAPS